MTFTFIIGSIVAILLNMMFVEQTTYLFYDIIRQRRTHYYLKRSYFPRSIFAIKMFTFWDKLASVLYCKTNYPAAFHSFHPNWFKCLQIILILIPPLSIIIGLIIFMIFIICNLSNWYKEIKDWL